MAGLVLLWAVTTLAQAQILDSVEVTHDGTDAFIRIKFAVLIQYLRHVPSDSGDTLRIFFQITAADESAQGVVVEERRPQPQDLVPRFRVEYPSQPQSVQRRIDVLFDSPVRFRVRPEDASTLLVIVPLTAEQRAKFAAAAAAAGKATAEKAAAEKVAADRVAAERSAAQKAAPASAPAVGLPPSPGAPAPVAPPPPPRAPDASVARVAPPPPPTPVPAAPVNDVERQAADEIAQARAAYAAGDFNKAIAELNRLLNLPPNAFSQEAQELIGLARENDGDPAKALAEYTLYLKLYPEGEGAARVRARLDVVTAQLAAGGSLGAPAPASPAAPVARGPAFTYWGGISQYYYGGQSQGETKTTIVTPATNATTIDTTKLSATDQKQLVTNVDLTARYRDATWDNRAVLHEQYTANFMRNQDSRNRLTGAYGEARYLPLQLMGRFGRQSATTGGVLGLFDGGVVSWGFAPNLRLNGVGGTLVDVPNGVNKSFYGVNFDADNLGGRWSTNAFVIRQTAGGADDRTGVGGEIRYFDAERSVYSLLDYDPTFRSWNIAMVQGTWQFPTGTTFNFIADYRRSPTLQLTNALLIDPSISFDALLQVKGVQGVRDLAKTVTPISKVYLASLTQTVTPKWQVGFDFRLSSLSGIPSVGLLPATPATGNIYTYTLQGIGSGLLQSQDILVVNGSALTGKLYNGQLATFDYRFLWRDVVIEPMLRWYAQQDSLGARLTRTTPGIKIVWKIKDRFYIEAEGDWERSHLVGPLLTDDVTRQFYYIGWRWDI